MLNRLTSLICCLMTMLTAAAQTDSIAMHRVSTHATLFGVGWANTYDTYLSPVEYTGVGVGMMHERQRMTHWNRISTQGLLRINMTLTENRAKNHNQYGGRISYQHAWHYNWAFGEYSAEDHRLRDSRLQLRAGLGVMGGLGGLYSSIGGNNPAQGYADVSLMASVAADYNFTLWHRTWTVSSQMDAPVLGMMFSPRYTQSYYDIFSRGNYDHNIVCTWPGNRPTLHGRMTIDVPVGRYTMRVGYAFDCLQALPNNLRQHTYTHNFVIGWVKRFALLP